MEISDEVLGNMLWDAFLKVVEEAKRVFPSQYRPFCEAINRATPRNFEGLRYLARVRIALILA